MEKVIRIARLRAARGHGQQVAAGASQRPNKLNNFQLNLNEVSTEPQVPTAPLKRLSCASLELGPTLDVGSGTDCYGAPYCAASSGTSRNNKNKKNRKEGKKKHLPNWTWQQLVRGSPPTIQHVNFPSVSIFHATADMATEGGETGACSHIHIDEAAAPCLRVLVPHCCHIGRLLHL